MLIIYVKVLLVTLALGLDSHLFSLYNTLVLSYIMMAFYLGVMLLEVLFTEFSLSWGNASGSVVHRVLFILG